MRAILSAIFWGALLAIPFSIIVAAAIIHTPIPNGFISSKWFFRICYVIAFVAMASLMYSVFSGSGASSETDSQCYDRQGAYSC